MDDIYFLRHLFEEIRTKYHLPHIRDWSNKHYSELSEHIYDSTGVLLSRNTLKNIIKKIIVNDRSYSPQSSTRNALALFLGFHDWKDYREKYHQLLQNEPEKVVTTAPIQKVNLNNQILLYALAGALVLIVGYVGIRMMDNHRRLAKNNFEINFSDTLGLAPHTISITYDFSNLKSRDSVLLDLDTYSAAGKYELKYFRNKQGIENFCYHHPGIYHVRLFINRKEVKQWTIFIKSHGWRANVYDAQVSNTQIPNWLWKYRDAYFRYINFDNVISTSILGDGFMEVTEEQAFSTPNIPKNYKTEFVNFQNYGVSGDNFRFGVLFFNPHFGQETFCYSAEITLLGAKDKLSFRIMQPGCKLYARYKFSENKVDGISENVNGFEHDFSSPRWVEIINQNKQITLKIDDSTFHANSYQNTIGRLIGIKFDFKGAAAVDSVALCNQFDQVIFSDSFDR